MSSSIAQGNVVVRFPGGLHMRPADKLVRLAGQFDSAIEIGRAGRGSTRGDGSDDPAASSGETAVTGEMMDCKSILSLLTLGAAEGDTLRIRAQGPDADDAVARITAWFEEPLSETNFNETNSGPDPAEEDTAGVAE